MSTADPEHFIPRAPGDEVRATWVGHATFLLQSGGLNLLTDPVWGQRASPVRWLGPARFTPPGLAFDDLPPLDAVLLSHDHYDHLDDPTVRRLLDRSGPDLPWLTPLGHAAWLGRRGFRRVVEMDWWEGTELDGLRVALLPARHWSRRGLRTNERLWGSWAVLPPEGPRVYFGGDSGYCPAFQEIGRRLGPFDLTVLPIGAYAPRWFMKDAHMDPEEAVRAYLDLGGAGGLLPMHWGAFRLSDEDPLEPPERLRAAWGEALLPRERLHLPGVGGTVAI